MPIPSDGESGAARHDAAAGDRVALARDPGAVDRERDELLRGPACRTARTASEPTKPVSSLQHQPRPASIGPRSVVRSFP